MLALGDIATHHHVNGVSTRKLDQLVEQLGLHGMSKDQVSRLCRRYPSETSMALVMATDHSDQSGTTGNHQEVPQLTLLNEPQRRSRVAPQNAA